MKKEFYCVVVCKDKKDHLVTIACKVRKAKKKPSNITHAYAVGTAKQHWFDTFKEADAFYKKASLLNFQEAAV